MQLHQSQCYRARSAAQTLHLKHQSQLLRTQRKAFPRPLQELLQRTDLDPRAQSGHLSHHDSRQQVILLAMTDDPPHLRRIQLHLLCDLSLFHDQTPPAARQGTPVASQICHPHQCSSDLNHQRRDRGALFPAAVVHMDRSRTVAESGGGREANISTVALRSCVSRSTQRSRSQWN